LRLFDAISGGFTMAKFRLGLCGAVVLLGAVCLPIAAADAATVTDSFSFSASGFTPSGSPVDTWTGSFTMTFDPTGGIESGALDAFSSNLPAIYDTFTFVYFGGLANGALDIGNDCSTNGSSSGCGLRAGTDLLGWFRKRKAPASLSGVA
jgi:hypothetical protein